MTELKIIRTEKEYNDALRRIDKLMDTAVGFPEEEELELLLLLVEKYEREHFPIEPPDPVEAILFRMDQEGLTASDMVTYLGSQSRVSEVLNRKRQLSLKMIRNLHQGFDIPLESLIMETSSKVSRKVVKTQSELGDFIYIYNCLPPLKAGEIESLQEWYSKVLNKAQKQELPPFDREKLGTSFVEELFGLCAYSAGPKMAHELLNKKGIHLIIQKKPLKIEFDGACFIMPERNPIISLTMRKNELDDFWFILLHLIAHVTLQQEEKPVAIFDSIECTFKKNAPTAEIRANEFLKSILETAISLRTTRQSYHQALDLYKLEKNIQAVDINPELLSCWYRIENQGRNIAIRQSTFKKVSEKLEVYTA